MKTIRAALVLSIAGLLLTASPRAEISQRDWPTFRGDFGRTGRGSSTAPRTPGESFRVPTAVKAGPYEREL